MKCPNHPEQTLHPLKYQKASGKPTKGGNRGTEWITTNLYFCESCQKPLAVRIEIEPISAV